MAFCTTGIGENSCLSPIVNDLPTMWAGHSWVWSVWHILHLSVSTVKCILTVCHILVECNHLAQTRNYIFGRCGVVESFSIPPWISFKIFKRFWILFIAQLFTPCFFNTFKFFNYITTSCIYLFLTPNSRSVFRAGVSLNIHSFIHSFYLTHQNLQTTNHSHWCQQVTFSTLLPIQRLNEICPPHLNIIGWSPSRLGEHFHTNTTTNCHVTWNANTLLN